MNIHAMEYFLVIKINELLNATDLGNSQKHFEQKLMIFDDLYIRFKKRQN